MQNGEVSNIVEVYKDFNFQEAEKVIELKGITGKKYVYYGIEVTKDLIRILIREQTEGSYFTKLIVFNHNGDLVDEYCLPIGYAYNIILNGNILYYIKNKTILNNEVKSLCLFAYILDKGEELYIDDDVMSVFLSSQYVFFIKAQSSQNKSDYYSLYKITYNENISTVLLRDVDIHGEITSAAYDYDSNILYCVDYSTIYCITDTEEKSVLSATNTYADIKALTGNFLIIQVGNNQVSIYEKIEM